MARGRRKKKKKKKKKAPRSDWQHKKKLTQKCAENRGTKLTAATRSTEMGKSVFVYRMVCCVVLCLCVFAVYKSLKPEIKLYIMNIYLTCLRHML